MGLVAAQENRRDPMIFSSSVSDMAFSYDGGIKRNTCWNGCGAVRQTALASSASLCMARKQTRARRWEKASWGFSVPLCVRAYYRGTGVVKVVSTDVVAMELLVPHVTTSSVEAACED